MAAGAGGEGLFAALRNLLAILLASGRTRLELLGTEIAEETQRLLSLLAMGIAALFLLGLGIVLLIVCTAAAFWEQRVAILGMSALLTLGGGYLFFSRTRRLLQEPSNLFRTSLAELDADIARLKGKSPEQP